MEGKMLNVFKYTLEKPKDYRLTLPRREPRSHTCVSVSLGGTGRLLSENLPQQVTPSPASPKRSGFKLFKEKVFVS